MQETFPARIVTPTRVHEDALPEIRAARRKELEVALAVRLLTFETRAAASAQEQADAAARVFDKTFAVLSPIIGGCQRDGEVAHYVEGLGLYIASQIVRSHGGWIDAQPSAGKATFSIRLPRCPPMPHGSAAPAGGSITRNRSGPA